MDRNKYQIHIPLPPKIDPSVTMMQVEEKPDVTYSDVGGCKEQIEKLREVVETPLLHVRLQFNQSLSNLQYFFLFYSQKDLLILVLNPQREFYYLDPLELAKRYVQEQLLTELMLASFELLGLSWFKNTSAKYVK